ncbi:MAG TPA: DUF2339 domain-containing protein [Anaeromyxobacteraceae bacterium]|nr:DUF2339 domain-containing protein [Anaeromyxobacteraceae bacterium]
MWVVGVILAALLMLLGLVFLALGAWLRAEEARKGVLLIQKRLGAIEQQLGIVRPQPARPKAAEARAPAAPGASLEEKIALVWFARIGAGILLVGALFFLLAPGGISGSARVGAGVLFGLVAIGFAEANRRRARPLFNQVVLGMGVAVLLFTAFASHRFYGVASPGAAFAAVAAAGALGAFLAQRHRAEIALVLAVAGGLLAPVILWREAPASGLLAWLLAFPLAAAAVAVRGVFPWSLWLSLLGSSGLAAGWALRAWDFGPGGAFHPLSARLVPLAFAILHTAGFGLAHRAARSPGRERLQPLPLLVALLLGGHALFAVYLRDQPALLAFFFAALGLGGAYLLGREMQSALLMVPLAAAFFVLLGSVRAASPGLTIAPLAAWGAVYGASLLRPGKAALALSGVAGTAFLVLAGELLAPHRPRWFAAVAVAWSLAYAWLAMTRRSPLLLAATGLVAFLGLAGAAAPISDQGDLAMALLCAAWSLVYLGGLAFRAVRQRETPEPWHVAAAGGAGAALAALVLLLTGPEERLARAAFFWGVAAAHLGLGAALLGRARRAATALLALAVGFAVVGVTFPLPGAGSTLCWAGLATLLVGAGFARQSRLTRSLGLGLFAATVLKVALWDLWRLGRAWQVSVLLAVGALLLLASYFYARRGGRPREAAAERPAESPPTAPVEPAPPRASGGD